MKRESRPFTSRMSKKQVIFTLLYLPVHAVGLPFVFTVLMLRGYLEEMMANLLIYAVGAVLMLLCLGRFFRREFDPICDRPLDCLVEVCVGYGLILAGNLLASWLMGLIGLTDSANNEAVFELAGQDLGPTVAMSVFLAPIVEETIFRGAIFGPLRHKSRWLAYAVSALLFSAYHVVGYAVLDPKEWLYIIEYLPASLMLARCYERTDSLWGSIFLHMLTNGVAMWLVTYAG